MLLCRNQYLCHAFPASRRALAVGNIRIGFMVLKKVTIAQQSLVT
jgi:hypothetical protein